MIDEKICEWLMDNADAPIRYRVARELLKDGGSVIKNEPELLENKEVQKWLVNLRNENPPTRNYYEHGSFNVCLENALPKLTQLGLHRGLQPFMDAASFYLSRDDSPGYNWISVNMYSLAGITGDKITATMLKNLEMMHRFVHLNTYDFYIDDDERDKLLGVPKIWKNQKFIKPQLRDNNIKYPFIYDILGMFRLYELKDAGSDKKIDGIIDYISTDEFHARVADGYGILIDEARSYHSQGWDPKYPGWFGIADCIGRGGAPKLLFFAQNIVNYPRARKTKWFNELMNYLEQYKTDGGTYIFPKNWIAESQGYAVQGHHLSYGENRKKKNWIEVESTFYMLSLMQKFYN